MTLVVGMRFQDGVAVAGDTRVTCSDALGQVTHTWDNAQKVYYLPPLVVGISGDVEAAAHVLGAYVATVMDDSRRDYLEAMALDPQQVFNCFSNLYDIVERTLSRREPPEITLLLAACGRQIESQLPPADIGIAVSTPTLQDTAAAYYRADKQATTLVVLAEFPSGQIHVAGPGEILLMGSGRYIDTVLERDVAFRIGARCGSLRARTSLVLSGFSTFCQGDETFNNLVHATTLDSRQVNCVGSCHNTRALEYQFSMQHGGTAVPLEVADRRPDLEVFDHHSASWRETLFDGSLWWVYDYATSTKFPLRNILFDYGRNSPQWRSAFVQAAPKPSVKRSRPWGPRRLPHSRSAPFRDRLLRATLGGY